MTYQLALADRSYSSWSLRIGLLVARYDLPIELRFARLYTDAFPALLTDFVPARTVPALRTPEGITVTESLAIAEELASRFPDRGLWPEDPAARAIARGLASEMHAGFFALRDACPMNLRKSYVDFPVSTEVQADLERLETIWGTARAAFAGKGPWLCGEYSIADAFFAPVAGRIAGYGLKVGTVAQAYVDAHLSDPHFLAWRATGLEEGPDQDFYYRPFETKPWPEPGKAA